jgi:hypothetical protein
MQGTGTLHHGDQRLPVGPGDCVPSLRPPRYPATAAVTNTLKLVTGMCLAILLDMTGIPRRDRCLSFRASLSFVQINQLEVPDELYDPAADRGS